MRRTRKVLLALPAAGLCAVALAASAAGTPPPGSDYAWAQPGTAAATVPFAQPPASVPTPVVSALPGSGYEWAQPGAAPPVVPFSQPPALIPA